MHSSYLILSKPIIMRDAFDKHVSLWLVGRLIQFLHILRRHHGIFLSGKQYDRRGYFPDISKGVKTIAVEHMGDRDSEFLPPLLAGDVAR